MRKHYLLLVVLMLMMDISLFAKPVNTNEAMSIAQNFWQQKSTTRAVSSTLRLAYTAIDDANATRSASSANLFYVFNSGESDGFIVVAGDDRMRPILGYTSNGTFDINTANQGLQWWLSAITAKAKAVVNGTDKSTFASTRSSGSVDPIVQTKWNQYSPYNNLCPVDNTDGNGARGVTGCVATAMAQILYTCYSGTTQTLTGTVTCRPEAHASATQDVDLSNYTIDYSKMDLTYDGDESDESKNAVATLMYACGLSVNMDYCAGGSGSNASSYVFKKHFGIDNNCQLVHRSQYTNDEWDNLIRGELNEGRAVLYSGSAMCGDGHAFICDGYDTEGLYHINWGWGGYNDGYFDFYSLDFYYVNTQNAVCGIKPGTSNLSSIDMLSYETISASALPMENVTSMTCKIKNLQCKGCDFTGYFGLALCKSDGSIIQSLGLCQSNLINNYLYSSDFTFSFPNGLADGTYELRVVAGTTTDNLQVVQGTGSYAYLTVMISNGSITVSSPQQEAKLLIQSYSIGGSGSFYTNQTTPLTLVIKNEGGEFYGSISSSSETEITSFKAVIKAGETKTFVTNVTPTSKGTRSFDIYAADEYYVTTSTIGTVEFDVRDEGEVIPNLVVESAAMESSEIYYGQLATLVVKLRNDGENFEGGLYAMTTVPVMACELPSDTVSISLKKGESTTVELNISYLGVFTQGDISSGDISINSLNIKREVDNVVYKSTIKTFEGDEAITVTVKPQDTEAKLSIEKIWMENDAIKYGDKAILHMTIKNAGGTFANFIVLNWLDRTQNLQFRQEVSFTLEAGTTKTFNVEVDYATAFQNAGVESGFCELSNITCFLDVPPTKYESLDFDYVSFTVGKKSQSITWNQSFTDIFEGDEITLTATASSGLPIEYAITQGSDLAVITDNTLVCSKAGEVVIEARQQGNDNFKAAESVSKTITIQAKGSISISTSEASLPVEETLQLTATSSLGKSINWASSDESVATVSTDGLVTAKGIGTTTITASAANSISATCTITVTRKSQSITWDQSFTDIFEGDEITLTATASSGLPIEYAITQGSDLAVITDNTLVCNKAGEVVIEARQQGDNNFKAAESVSKTITIQLKTGIDALYVSGLKLIVSDGTLKIIGTTDGQKIIIYTPSGAIVKEQMSTGETTSIGGLLKGQTYIIKVGNTRLKVAL